MAGISLIENPDEPKPATVNPAGLVIPARSTEDLRNVSIVCEPGQASWRAFKSLEGGFEVLFPGEPRMERTEMPTGFGPSFEFSATDESGELALFASYTTLPYEDRREAAAILDGSQKGASASTRDALTEAVDLTVQGFPARRLAWKGALRSRMLVVVARGKVFSVVAAIAADKPAREKDVTRFLQSFRLLN
jgi:hypothetical protein